MYRQTADHRQHRLANDTSTQTQIDSPQVCAGKGSRQPTLIDDSLSQTVDTAFGNFMVVKSTAAKNMSHDTRRNQRISRDDQLASVSGVSEITIAESSTRGRPSSCDTNPASIGSRSRNYEVKDEPVNLSRRVMRRVEHAILNISPAFFCGSFLFVLRYRN